MSFTPYFDQTEGNMTPLVAPSRQINPRCFL